MTVNAFSVNPGAMQVARREFYRRKRGSKKKGTFELYFELFSNGANTFTDIGNRLSITKEAVRQIYQKYFASLFPDRPDGISRRKVHAIQCRELQFKTFPLPDPLGEIARVVSPYACEGIRARHPHPKYRKRVLIINTKRCRIHHVKAASKLGRGNKRLYTVVHTTSDPFAPEDFVIVIQNVTGYPKRFFVLPAKEVVSPRRSRTTLYLPLEKLAPYHNLSQRIDFWKYENAWHLLG